MDPAAADVGGTETLRAVITAGRLDIVHHQVKRRRRTCPQGELRRPYDDMRAAAELEDREVCGGENRSQPHGFEPPRRGGDVGCRTKVWRTGSSNARFSHAISLDDSLETEDQYKVGLGESVLTACK